MHPLALAFVLCVNVLVFVVILRRVLREE